ncbi:hypothetical protein D3C77_606610 [compost metagenome]
MICAAILATVGCSPETSATSFCWEDDAREVEIASCSAKSIGPVLSGISPLAGLVTFMLPQYSERALAARNELVGSL